MADGDRTPDAGTGGAAYLTVGDTADRLGVKAATVYAYISRGLLSSHREPGDRRSWIRLEDVEEFRRRHAGRRPTDGKGAEAGGEEPITTIADDRLLFRGHDATTLAVTWSFESIAELLWTGRLAEVQPWRVDQTRLKALRAAQQRVPDEALPSDRLKIATAVLGSLDPFRYDLTQASVMSAARSLLSTLVRSLPATPGTGEAATSDHLGTSLWCRLGDTDPGDDQARLLNAALVLLADHGPAPPSTRAVRSAASLAADPYSAVLAGMGVASGLLHGGSSLAAQSLLEDIANPAEVTRALAQRLRSGERLSGFGQPRYRQGDPRAAFLLALLEETRPDSERLEVVRAVIDLVRERRGMQPNVEFALGAVCYTHGLTFGAGEAAFVVARCAGWLAHAMQEYAAGPAGTTGTPTAVPPG